jgi:hypothetical protein
MEEKEAEHGEHGGKEEDPEERLQGEVSPGGRVFGVLPGARLGIDHVSSPIAIGGIRNHY